MFSTFSAAWTVIVTSVKWPCSVLPEGPVRKGTMPLPWRRRAPTGFRVSAPGFPLKGHLSPWRAQLVQVCVPPPHNSPPAGVGGYRQQSQRLETRSGLHTWLRAVTHLRGSTAWGMRLRTLPCSLGVYGALPADSGEISLRGHKTDTESFLRATGKTRDVGSPVPPIPKPKVGATS